MLPEPGEAGVKKWLENPPAFARPVKPDSAEDRRRNIEHAGSAISFLTRLVPEGLDVVGTRSAIDIKLDPTLTILAAFEQTLSSGLAMTHADTSKLGYRRVTVDDRLSHPASLEARLERDLAQRGFSLGDVGGILRRSGYEKIARAWERRSGTAGWKNAVALRFVGYPEKAAPKTEPSKSTRQPVLQELYDRLDGYWQNGVTPQSHYPAARLPAPRELSREERTSLANMEANWGLSR